MIIYKHDCVSGYFYDEKRISVENQDKEQIKRIGQIIKSRAFYILDLTFGERKGIDFVGYRYNNGSDFKYILIHDSVIIDENNIEVESDWLDRKDLTFAIPESAAWEIKDLLESDDVFCPCFSPDFKSKLHNFIDEII